MSVWRERLLVLLVIAAGTTVLAARTLRSMERAGVSGIRLGRCFGSIVQYAHGTAREGAAVGRSGVDVVCETSPYALWPDDEPRVRSGVPDDGSGFTVRFANVECSVCTTADRSQVTERLAAALVASR